MKLIIAYIKPERLNAVKQSLYDAKIIKMSVTNALGCGEEQGFHEDYRGIGIEVDLLKKAANSCAILLPDVNKIAVLTYGLDLSAA